jgi:glutathione S-transferase
MAKYLLVSFKTCPWVQRAAIVLREKNIEFEFRHIEPDNRPDWFLAISPHKKVPVLRIDDTVSLFESNAIAEYLDETVAPRLHPEDPVARAVNRAWTDYVPTFADSVTATAYADTAADYDKAVEGIPVPFERLERALEKQGDGPLFNGARYSLVDAAYAPFLQRYFFLDRVRKIGHIGSFHGSGHGPKPWSGVRRHIRFRRTSSRRCTAAMSSAATNGCRNSSTAFRWPPSRRGSPAPRSKSLAGAGPIG